MRYSCRDLGIYFDLYDENFVTLNDEGKVKFFKMSEQDLKQNLYVFMETRDNKFTGRNIQINLDPGFYPTLDDVKRGQDLCRDNVLKYMPNVKLISETNMIPQNIRKCVWDISGAAILSQYYVSKKGYMFCIAGAITEPHDSLDELMASVAISMTSDSPQDKKRAEQQEIMSTLTDEVNKLLTAGVPFNEAWEIVRRKFGIK